jgi:hypothetical protein
MSTEFEEVFPTYDSSGHRITPVHSHNRILTAECTPTFAKPDCTGSCAGCSGKVATAKCKARQLGCKGVQVGFSFPFMSNPASLLGLLSNKDIEIIDFRPPPMTFSFEARFRIPLNAIVDLVVKLYLEFGASARVEFALVLGKLIVCSIFSLVIST